MQKLEQDPIQLWEKMYDMWKSQKVPPVSIIKFVPGKHMIKRPWFNIKEKQQESYKVTPVFDTAYHLVKNLENKEPEIVAAFKIHSFIRTYYRPDLLGKPLLEVLKKYDLNFNWWPHNARYVLPDINFDGYIYGSNLENKDWRKLVILAADAWKEIAASKAIIAIPDFLDWESQEYKEFRKYSEEENDKERFQRYLQLKKEYEKEEIPNNVHILELPKEIFLTIRIDKTGKAFISGRGKEGDFELELW